MGAKEMFDLVDYSTSDWGAEADYDPAKHGGAREGNDQIFVHHPGYEIREAADGGNIQSEKATLRDIESGARKRDWWGIQYDIIVGQSGSIYEGRGLCRSGATSGDVDDDGTHNNDEGEAVLVLVSPDTPMTEACKASLKRVLDAHGGDVYGHKEAKGTKTSCPGADRMQFLGGYRDGAVETKPDPAPTKQKKTAPKKQDWTEQIMAELGVHKRGDKGPRVKRVQALVNMSGLNSLKVDGVFGPRTERAVVEYQDHFRLAVDGIVGPQTWKHLLLASY